MLIVAVNGVEVVATMQLSFLPGLTRRGALRARVLVRSTAIDPPHKASGKCLLLVMDNHFLVWPSPPLLPQQTGAGDELCDCSRSGPSP